MVIGLLAAAAASSFILALVLVGGMYSFKVFKGPVRLDERGSGPVPT